MSADDDAEWSAVDANIDEEVATAMAITPQEVVVSGLPAFRLKHPGTCTGMYWRPHPPGAPEHRIPGSRAQRPPWPRNGSILIGEMHQLDRPIEGNHLARGRRIPPRALRVGCASGWGEPACGVG